MSTLIWMAVIVIVILTIFLVICMRGWARANDNSHKILKSWEEADEAWKNICLSYQAELDQLRGLPLDHPTQEDDKP